MAEKSSDVMENLEIRWKLESGWEDKELVRSALYSSESGKSKWMLKLHPKFFSMRNKKKYVGVIVYLAESTETKRVRAKYSISLEDDCGSVYVQEHSISNDGEWFTENNIGYGFICLARRSTALKWKTFTVVVNLSIFEGCSIEEKVAGISTGEVTLDEIRPQMMEIMKHQSSCNQMDCETSNCKNLKGFLKHESDCKNNECKFCLSLWRVFSEHKNECENEKCLLVCCSTLEPLSEKRKLMLAVLAREDGM